ncbi:unnamed protein product, partial [Ectocarpus sp. 12 AP-2014]
TRLEPRLPSNHHHNVPVYDAASHHHPRSPRLPRAKQCVPPAIPSKHDCFRQNKCRGAGPHHLALEVCREKIIRSHSTLLLRLPPQPAATTHSILCAVSFSESNSDRRQPCSKTIQVARLSFSHPCRFFPKAMGGGGVGWGVAHHQ